MLNMKNYILLFYLLITAFLSYGQKYDFEFISTLKVNETKVIKSKEQRDKITFLGNIKNKNGKFLYHIVKLYSFVYGSSHGFSIIYYLGNDYVELNHYEIGNPNELPYKLAKNKLYFKYNNEKGKKKTFILNVGITIPKVLCVAPNNCY